MMQLCVIGCGYVGLVSAACFASLGYRVACYDQSAQKREALRAGRSPIYEPGLEALLEAHRDRLHVTDTLEEALEGASIAFICVGTPTIEATGEANLDYVTSAAQSVAQWWRAQPRGTKHLLLVTKSTVPVGTNRNLLERFGGGGLSVASNPEFLREGNALHDFMHPDRIVIGVEGDVSRETLTALYAPLLARHSAPLVVTGLESAEMIKYASNTFLAMRIAFINEIADICESVGADVEQVAHGVGLDPRLGSRYLRPGPGYGGSCFPKDTRALRAIARNCVIEAPVTHAVVESNERRRQNMARKVMAACGGSVTGKRLAIWGLTFKPGTDDMRESPSLYILPPLLEAGASLYAYDPQGMEEAAKLLHHPQLHYAVSAHEAAEGADALIILTEWEEFRKWEPAALAAILAPNRLIVDMRNLYSPTDMAQAGITYHSIGRPPALPLEAREVVG